MSIQEVFAMIHSNLGLHELSFVSLHPKNNCPEQVFWNMESENMAICSILFLQLEALFCGAPYKLS